MSLISGSRIDNKRSVFLRLLTISAQNDNIDVGRERKKRRGGEKEIEGVREKREGGGGETEREEDMKRKGQGGRSREEGR